MIYYQLSLYLAIALSGLFLWRLNRHISVSLTVICLLIPIVNLGYFRIAVSDTVSEAVFANGLVYLCSMYLQLANLVYVCSLCRVKLPKIISAVFFQLNAFISIAAFTTLNSKLMYTDVSLGENADGIKFLIKSYGPAHTVYYVVLVSYVVIELGVLIYGFRRRDVSKKNATILFLMHFINVFAFLLARGLKLTVELQPAGFVLTQVVLLIMCSRLRLYAIEDIALNMMVEKGRTGYVCFDRSRHFMGANAHAKVYLPELLDLYIDGPVGTETGKFSEILSWLDAADAGEDNTEFVISRGDITLRVNVDRVRFGRRDDGYQVRLEDITEERRYISLLQEARQSAEDVSKAKGEFLANMSHEIRTPINAILGMDEMILRESGEDQTIEYAEDIRKAGNTLLGLINDILDFSKIEAGKTDIIPVEYRLSSVITDLLNMIEPRAKEKGLSLIVNVDPDIPDCLRGDEMRIRQIIMNILTNAVKYTHSGSVTLSVSQERGDGKTTLIVAVADTGIGIKKEDIDRLFIAFERVDEGTNRSIEGTGLGISITQRLLVLMGSHLEVESVYGKGSTFSFRLVQEIVRYQPIGEYDRALDYTRKERKKYRESFHAPKAKLLVVDDTPMNLIVFRGLLKKTLMNIDCAGGGDEAIKLARENEYDIIFLDHRMPGKDGVQTLHEMRSDPDGLNAGTPAVCLTANAVSGMRDKYIAEGFREYITKPIDPVRLEALIVELLSPGLVTRDRESTEAPVFVPGERPKYDEDHAQLVSIYRSEVAENARLIRQLYEAQDWENYTIKVHALKSTSRIVGETAIADLAEKLEAAGDSGDTEYIREATPLLLDLYESRMPVMPDPQQDRSKPMADEQMILEAYDAINDAVQSYDYDALCDVTATISEYRIPDSHLTTVRKIAEAADKVDWGAIRKILSEIAGK